jgi:glycosyltransferase involved in cell wall biosynthesis
MTPLVSIILLCHAHENFVIPCLEAIKEQNYKNIEVLLVDDASPDNSVEKITQWCKTNGKYVTKFIALQQNIGNCKAFNQALVYAKGKYVIDLAADDILLPHCIENQVLNFEKLPENYAVVFANANYIDLEGNILYPHHKKNEIVAQNDIYQQIIQHSFICTPTMMMRKTVLDELHGYDEQLSYEDFDWWIRSSRKYYYAYIDKILVHKRIVKNSLGSYFYNTQAQKHLYSTYLICKKIALQNRKKEEDKALAYRIRYFLRLCCYTGNYEIFADFYLLLQQIDKLKVIDIFWKYIAKYQIPLQKLYTCYTNTIAIVSKSFIFKT